MPVPGLRRGNSLRTREHRRIYNNHALGLQLLGLSIICISVLLTIFELSSDRNLGVGDGSHQMVGLGIARGMQLSSLHRNHLRGQGSHESNQQKAGSVEVTQESQSEVEASAGPLFVSVKTESVGQNVLSRTSESPTFGQRLLRFLAPWKTDDDAHLPCALYSSLQRDLVAQGLVKQSGWGHAWRTFGGRLACKNQPSQCARTALLPYAWWDAPWQSPTSRDINIMRNMGIEIDEVGNIAENTLDGFCGSHLRLKPTVYNSKLPEEVLNHELGRHALISDLVES